MSIQYSRTLPELVGLEVKAGAYGRVRNSPTAGAPLWRNYAKGATIGRTTGRLARQQGSQYIYIGVRPSGSTEEKWIEYRNVFYPPEFTKAFDLTNLATRAFSSGTEERQKEFSDFLGIQNRILFELLIAARLMQQMQAGGKQVPPQAYALYQQITTRYNDRAKWAYQNSSNAAIIKSMLLEKNWGIPLVIVSNIVAPGGLGALPLIPIVISLAAGAVLATVAIAIIRSNKEAAQVDFDKLPTLQRLLAEADMETAEKVRKEVQTVVDESFRDGADSGMFGDIKSLGKMALTAGGIFVGYQILKPFISK